MFNVQSDRLDYGELLSPPPKYQTAFVVGTTYTLDLETLTAACAIIGLNIEADSALTKTPLYMLEAIRKASGRLLIFCNGGRIKAPDKPNRLLPLLENCVCEVYPKSGRSFHPKVWFIKYSADKLPDRYRLIVLSRNLTFDHSWDVVLRLDSADAKEAIIPREEGAGDAMKEFLMWLSKNSHFHNNSLKAKRKQLLGVAKAMVHTEWKSLGKAFESMDFIPYGVGSSAADRLGDTFHELFVISPFVSKSVLEGFAARRLTDFDCTLVTRKSELPKLGVGLLAAFDVYTVKDNVIDGEERISESGDPAALRNDKAGDETPASGGYKTQDIHAKVYLRTKSSRSDLYIGSANASYNAFHGGNIECLIALRGQRRYLNVKKLKADLGIDHPDDPSCPFERAEPKSYDVLPEDEAAQKLEDAIRECSLAKKSAVVSGDGPYSVTVTLKPPQADAKLTLSPLMKDRPQRMSESITFAGLALRELSEWYMVTARCRGRTLSRIVKIQTKGIPEGRDAAVFSDIIRDKNAFLEYISFLLSDDYLSALVEGLKKGKGDSPRPNKIYDAPILYERMLKAAANAPESLREVREIIRLMNDRIVPPDFATLYEQFEKVVK